MIQEQACRPACEGYTRKWVESKKREDSYYVPEKYQLGIVTAYLDSRDIAYTTEGEIFCYPIDVIGVQGDTTIAIELKSRNIGKGIEQACRNLDFVDLSYLSVWESDITPTLQERVSDLKIGLMGIDSEANIYSNPTKTSQQLCRKRNIVELVDNNVRGDASIQQQ